MYQLIEEYWNCEKVPFNNVPDPNFFYPSKVHKEALARVNYTVTMSQGIALLTGEVGSGKTILSRMFINDLSDEKYDIALLVNPMLSHEDFLREILYQLGVEHSTNVKIDLIHTLNNRILENSKKQKNTVIVVDEAQLIESDVIFEELRLLLNFQTNDRFLLTLILIGQAELRQNIARLKQLDQRIAVKYHLKALDKDDTFKYIAYRLKRSGIKRDIFTLGAYYKTYELSQGIPRKINNICNLAMLIVSKTGKNIISDRVIENAAAINR